MSILIEHHFNRMPYIKETINNSYPFSSMVHIFSWSNTHVMVCGITCHYSIKMIKHQKLICFIMFSCFTWDILIIDIYIVTKTRNIIYFKSYFSKNH